MRTASRRRRRALAELRRWIDVLWQCRCAYHNISANRCFFWGKRAPQDLRDRIEAVPVPDEAAI